MLKWHESYIIIPHVQFDDLIYYQNAISRSQGNFPEVREKSGKMKFEKKVATLLNLNKFF